MSFSGSVNGRPATIRHIVPADRAGDLPHRSNPHRDGIAGEGSLAARAAEKQKNNVTHSLESVG